MAEYNVIRNMPYFGDKITTMDDIFSFTASKVNDDKEEYFGFFDCATYEFIVIGPYNSEIHLIHIKWDEGESIDSFEKKLNNEVYENYDEYIQIRRVATDYSLMREMEW